jgi:hypothetical protein
MAEGREFELPGDLTSKPFKCVEAVIAASG